MECGSSNILFEIPDGDNRARHNCSECNFILYRNPRIIVGCLVEEKGRVLLAQRAIEPAYGKWNLPAGFLEEDEDVASGAARETREETGFDIEIGHLHCVYSVPDDSHVFVIFKATTLERISDHTPESLEVRLFDPEEIPWLEIAFPSNTYALKKYLQNRDEIKGTHVGYGN
jgi:ADP-ribose pyrophosphatase YjhB (NUDIX family)